MKNQQSIFLSNINIAVTDGPKPMLVIIHNRLFSTRFVKKAKNGKSCASVGIGTLKNSLS